MIEGIKNVTAENRISYIKHVNVKENKTWESMVLLKKRMKIKSLLTSINSNSCDSDCELLRTEEMLQYAKH